MSWLLAQVWVWMLAAGAAGAALTTWSMTTRVTVEKWVEERREPVVGAPGPTSPVAPVAEEPPAPAAPPADQDAAATAPGSPFPVLPGAPEERPWEAEELWSRPARLAEPTGKHRARTDEWSDAATNWRSWAEEATGRGPSAPPAVAGDDDLFAADREAERLGLEAGVFPVSLEPREPQPHPGDDPFPYARPVEAADYTPPYVPPVFPGPDAADGGRRSA
jgi:hypothetical protein